MGYTLQSYRWAWLMQWVSQRPETEIAVVCHSSILHFMLSNFARDAAPAVQQDLRRFFGEIASCA
jgi:hypothetical protein